MTNKTIKTSFNWKCWLFGHDWDYLCFEYDDKELGGLHSFTECLRCGESDRIGKKFSMINILSTRFLRSHA